MLGLTVKKAFFSFWDHILVALLVNFGFVLVLTVPLVVPFVVSAASTGLSYAVLFVGVLLLSVYTGATAVYGYRLVGQAPVPFRWSDVRFFFRESLRISLPLGMVTLLALAVVAVSIPFYAAVEGFVGQISVAFLLFTALLWFGASQYILPWSIQLGSPFHKSVKKSLLFFVDNPGFSLVVLLGSVAIIGVSVFTAFLFPGITGLVVWHHTALELRLKKYGYLEAHPETPRHRIPWDIVLQDEEASLSSRTLRNAFMPWKN